MGKRKNRKGRTKNKAPSPPAAPQAVPSVAPAAPTSPPPAQTAHQWLEKWAATIKDHPIGSIVVVVLIVLGGLIGKISDIGGATQFVSQIVGSAPDASIPPSLRVSPTFRVVEGEGAEFHFPIRVTNVSDHDVMDQALLIEVKPPVSSGEFRIDRTNFEEKLVGSSKLGLNVVEAAPGASEINAGSSTFFVAKLVALGPGQADTFDGIVNQPRGRIFQMKASTVPRNALQPLIGDIHFVTDRREVPRNGKPGDQWIVLSDPDAGTP